MQHDDMTGEIATNRVARIPSDSQNEDAEVIGMVTEENLRRLNQTQMQVLPMRKRLSPCGHEHKILRKCYE